LRFLIDEMFPPAVAKALRDAHGHDAAHVTEVGLDAAEDPEVAAAARTQDRALVTENVIHFADEHDLVLMFVHKRKLPAGGAQATALAELLAGWAANHPAPYRGPHWPR
jgi:predicted nuclease of predicted toxin-antitoxin system